MRLRILLIALLLCSSMAFATAYTANTTGPWNVAATWSGVGVPGAGDTAKINNAVTVTCPVSVTCSVGLAAADNTTEALGCTDATATGTGKLIVNGTFIYSGVINQCNGTWTIGAGATITHDSSAHSAQHYPWNVGLNNATAALLDVSAGTIGSHITINIASSSGYSGGFTCGASCRIDNGLFTATYADFQDCGGPAASCVKWYGNAAGEGLSFDHVTCNVAAHGCGQLLMENTCATCNFFLTNSFWTVPNVTAGLFAIAADGSGNGISTTLTSGTRSFANSVIIGGVSLFSSTVVRGSQIHFTFSNTVLGTTCGASDATAYGANRSYQVDVWNNVILYSCVAAAGVPSNIPGGTLGNFIVLYTGDTGNPHLIATIVAPTTIDGAIAQLEGSQPAGSSNGDLFQTEVSPTANFAVSIKHVLSLPDGGGQAIGTFVNHSKSGANCDNAVNFCPLFTLENNTYGGTDSGTLAIGAGGENNPALAGMFASVRNNLIYYSLTGSTFNAGIAWATKWSSGTTPVANSYSNADYNGFINATAGPTNRYFRSGSDPTEYTIAPGTHDVSVATNPFVDPTRNFQKWCQTQDAAATTFALCVADFKSGTISTSLISTLYSYIRAGWTPNDPTVARAGYDGATLGAVQEISTQTGIGGKTSIGGSVSIH